MAKGNKSKGNNTNKQQKFPGNDSPTRNASRSRISAEDLKKVKLNISQQPSLQSPSQISPLTQKPKQKAKQQEK